MNINYSKFLKLFLSIKALVIIDQISKTFLISYLKTRPGYTFELLPFLDIVYAWNYGISFGLFRQYYQYSNYIFLGLSGLIIIWLFCLYKKNDDYFSRLGLILIIAGAIGNLIDRAIRGAVFDFILLHHNGYSFPIFNIADSFITIGAIFFFYAYLKELRLTQKQTNN